MADIPENPVVLDIMETYGAIILGIFFACMLWGISCLQMLLYYHNYENDHRALKVLVAFVWVVNTVDLGLMMKSVFPVLILQWGRVAGLLESQPEYLQHNYLIALVAIGVQSFFLWRIYVFSGKSWYFPVLMQPVVWWQLIGTIPFNVTAMATKDIAVLSSHRQLAISSSYRAAMTFVDVSIAAALTFLLLRGPDSVFKGRIVTRLLMITVNTGTWTAIFALLVLISQFAWQGTLMFCIFENPLGSIYVNTLLANLNARRYISNGTSEVEWPSTNITSNIGFPRSGADGGVVMRDFSTAGYRGELGGRGASGQDTLATVNLKVMQGDDESDAGGKPNPIRI